MKQIESEVLKTYAATGSIKATARELGISEVKTRKILITHDKLEGCEMADKVKTLLAEGLTVKDIAGKLKVSEKLVNNYIPYTKTIYGDEPSANALRIRKHRSNKSPS